MSVTKCDLSPQLGSHDCAGESKNPRLIRGTMKKTDKKSTKKTTKKGGKKGC
jgi:hypothetical protein